MDRSPVERILDDWDQVANRAQLPATAPRRAWRGGSLGGLSLLPLAAAALAIAIGVAWLGGRIGGNVGAIVPTASAVSGGAPSLPTASTPPSSAASVAPAVAAACDAPSLTAQITAWEGAAGSRIAAVTVINGGTETCGLPSIARPALVDGSGRGLAVGQVPTGNVKTINLAAGAGLTTLVLVANVCGAAPIAPVSVSFDLGDGHGVDARPLSADDVTVPPCNGPTLPAQIEMQEWAR
jgi:hypothetical protein